MRSADQFHLGIVTSDFEATRATLSALFGHEWGPEVGAPTTVTSPDGEGVVELRCAFSITLPRLEIVRSVPGTLWEPVAGAGIHHIGFWSDDVAADSAELTASGYATEAARYGADGAPEFAFLSAATGFRVELVSRAMQPGLEQCWKVR